MRLSSFLKTGALTIAVALAACGGPSITRPPMTIPTECEVLSDPGTSPDSVSIALFDPVNPHFAPWARSAAEQLLFSHLYETLITIDCRGEVHPGLAESWKSRRDGRRWILQIRTDAKFWDGSQVTAQNIVDSWQRSAVEPMTLFAAIDSVSATSDNTLQVDFVERHRTVPRALASPSLAVAKAVPASSWPLGSGPYRIAPSGDAGALPGDVVITQPMFGAKRPIVRFIESVKYDARDLLEGAMDILVTADPDVLDYARERPDLATVALPWNQSYVLLSTSRVKAIQNGDVAAPLSEDFLESLARDVVRSDARGHQATAWWDDPFGCPNDGRGMNKPADFGRHRVVYDARDPIARDLAERIVALGEGGATASAETRMLASAVPSLVDTPVTAEGLARRELSQSLWKGADFAYVVAISRLAPDACYGWRQLLDRAPWLNETGFESILPLVDTRHHVIAKRDRFGLVFDWFGNILVMNEALWEDS